MTKPTAVLAATSYTRCTHRFAASGRQCRLLTPDPAGLCAQHLAKKKTAAQSADFANLLFSRADGLKTAQGINHSLTYLYELLARDQISVRRAQTLAYISSLVLRTLPAIDDENSRGMGSNAYQAALAKRSSAPSAPASDSASSSTGSALGSSALESAVGSGVALGSAIPDPPPHTKPS